MIDKTSIIHTTKSVAETLADLRRLQEMEHRRLGTGASRERARLYGPLLQEQNLD